MFKIYDLRVYQNDDGTYIGKNTVKINSEADLLAVLEALVKASIQLDKNMRK